MSRKIILTKTLAHLGPYRLHLVAALLLSLISVSLNLYLPILIGRVVDIIGAGSAAVWPLLKTMALVAALAALTAWLGSVLNSYIVARFVQSLRRQTFAKTQRLPLAYLDKHSHGDTLSRIVTDVEQLADGLLLGTTQMFSGIVTIVLTLVFMLSVNPAVTAVVVVLTPLSLLVAHFIAKHTFQLFREQSEIRGEQTAYVHEMVSNHLVVKAYGQEEAVCARFAHINERLGRCSLRAIFISSLTQPGTRFVNNMVYAGVAIVGALYALAGGLTVGQLTIFLFYANQYTKPFNEISEVVAELQNALACAGRVYEYLAGEEEECGRITSAPTRGDCVDSIGQPPTEGRVCLDHVHFSYRPDKPLLASLNLAVEPGQRTAIVGPSGCGKTTLINLLMRFYDVDSGRILLDGTDIRQLDRAELRKSFGMVLQDTWLRGGTVRDNIALGKPDASLEEIIAAAKATHADSFIRRLPHGYESIIEEDGGILSQGERQLLCITRVMLTLPPLLILDEATSSIDARTEEQIQQAFARLMEGRTSFIVAHRLATVRDADLILVMQNGRIVERGRHEELLAVGGLYSEMWEVASNQRLRPPVR
ncbi:MAG: ABC transporter ATP-binding protein/permease [Lachnospiraceae bacterium]|jgi:ATP-binding cassette subfamily B protein|nr:ABC transporter ATP-binding protein/permease [Lachnospiraceae bacterium]